MSTAQECSTLVLQKFRDLGIRVAPGTWTVLAAVVAHSPGRCARVVSLATGLKCAPAAALRKGDLRVDLVRDCHAEVLARRGLVAFLQHQWAAAAVNGTSNDILEYVYPELWDAQERNVHTCKDTAEGATRDNTKDSISKSKSTSTDCNARPIDPLAFRIAKDVSFSLWISHAPCGGASMASVAVQALDADGNRRHDDAPPRHGIHRGREHSCATLMGPHGKAILVPRTKPGRRDAPPVASLSCADKIARWTACGWQGIHLPFDLRMRCVIVADGWDADGLALVCESARAVNPAAEVGFVQSEERFEHGRADKLVPASSAHVWWEGLVRRGAPFETIVDGRLHGSRRPGPDGAINPAFVSSIATSRMIQRTSAIIGDITAHTAVVEATRKAKADLLGHPSSPYVGWTLHKREVMEIEHQPSAKRRRTSNHSHEE